MGSLCANNNKATSSTSPEYATGVPVTKALYVPSADAEYNQGIPTSKLRKAGLMVDDGPVAKKTKTGRKEYRTGVPMSKRMHVVHHDNDKKIPEKAEDAPLTKAKMDEAISIDHILQQDGAALRSLKQNLQQRGWCRITYPSKTNEIIQSAMNAVQQWMQQTDLAEKLTFSRKLADGSNKPNPQSEYSYNRIEGFKEGLRILTGEIYKVHYANGKYPDAVKEEILRLNEEFDGLAVRLMKVIYDSVYGLVEYTEFGSKYDISILNDGKQDGKRMHYSMLDFVNYFNDKAFIEQMRADEDGGDVDKDGNMKPKVLKSEFNVFAHSDPGLFALSFASTNQGLQMYDHSTDEWVHIGLDEGIWWNGKTANTIDGNIKSGEHRVKIDEEKFEPRFTGWYEVSCNRQLKAEVMEEAVRMRSEKSEVDGNEDTPDALLPAAAKEYDTGVPTSKIDMEFTTEPVQDYQVQNNADFSGFTYQPHDEENDNDELNIEFEAGIPMSKSGD